MRIGVLLLAGGRGRRMGSVDKALLTLRGETFLSRLLSELNGVGETLVSVDRAGRYPDLPVPAVPDLWPGTGPLGGLCSGLSACASEALLTVACDTPLFSRALAEYLLDYVSSDYDAFVTEDREGRTHFLCGVYRKTVLPAALELLERGEYRMGTLLDRLRVKRIPLTPTVFPDRLVSNINTPAEYERLLAEERGPVVIAVSGIKNSGKTTLLTRLIPVLKGRGYRLAVVKHDGHDFEPDVPGTDSWRLRKAGAEQTAVYSDRRQMILRQTGGEFTKLAREFENVDIILVEGLKDSAYPKIELVRGTGRPVCAPETLLAVMTDFPGEEMPLNRLEMDNIEGAASVIERYVREQRVQ